MSTYRIRIDAGGTLRTLTFRAESDGEAWELAEEWVDMHDEEGDFEILDVTEQSE